MVGPMRPRLGVVAAAAVVPAGVLAVDPGGLSPFGPALGRARWPTPPSGHWDSWPWSRRTSTLPWNPSGADYQVLFSRDGLTWSSQPLAALVDGPVARIGSVTVTDSKGIVTAIPPSPGTPADHATVVIGTV